MTFAIIYVQSVCTGNITYGHLIATADYPQVKITVSIGIEKTSVHILAHCKSVEERGVRLSECAIFLLDHQRSGLTPGTAHIEIIETILVYITHRHFRTTCTFFVWN